MGEGEGEVAIERAEGIGMPPAELAEWSGKSRREK